MKRILNVGFYRITSFIALMLPTLNSYASEPIYKFCYARLTNKSSQNLATFLAKALDSLKSENGHAQIIQHIKQSQISNITNFPTISLDQSWHVTACENEKKCSGMFKFLASQSISILNSTTTEDHYPIQLTYNIKGFNTEYTRFAVLELEDETQSNFIPIGNPHLSILQIHSDSQRDSFKTVWLYKKCTEGKKLLNSTDEKTTLLCGKGNKTRYNLKIFKNWAKKNLGKTAEDFLFSICGCPPYIYSYDENSDSIKKQADINTSAALEIAKEYRDYTQKNTPPTLDFDILICEKK